MRRGSAPSPRRRSPRRRATWPRARRCAEPPDEPPGMRSRVPGVDRRAVDEVPRGRGVPELGRHRLAEHDPARPPRALDDDRVRVGDVARVDPRAVRSLHAGRGRQVLEGDRDTVQRPDGLARDERGLGGPRVRTGLARGDDAERVDARVQRIDPREERVHDLDGRDLAVADERREPCRVLQAEGRGRSSPSATSRGTRGSGASQVAIAMRFVRLYIDAISATSQASSTVRPASSRL